MIGKIGMDKEPFKCAVCSKTFNTQDDLSLHYANHSPPIQLHVCDVCNKVLFDRDKLDKHMRHHRCRNQRYEQAFQKKPQTHRIQSNVVKSRQPIPIPICNGQFSNTVSFQNHFTVSKRRRFREKCEVCGKEFRERIFYEAHRLTHTDLKPFRCDVCEEVFVQKRNYLRHWNAHKQSRYAERHRRNKEAFICDVCRKEFDSRERLEWHIKTHDPFKCDVCLRIFDDRPTYMKHRNNHRLHNGGKALPENCSICNETFSCGIELLQHIARHEANNILECDICGKYFEDSTGLKRHRSSHEKKMSHNCDICGKVLEERIFFEIHRLTHFEQKPFPCDICDDIFSDKTAFLRHRNNHKPKEKAVDSFHNMRETLKLKLGKA